MSPAILVINLDRDADRLAYMQAQLARAALPFARFSAIDGADLPAPMRSYFPPGTPLSRGEIGCYASHLAICQRIAARRVRAPVLVLEDDVALPGDLPALMASLILALPPRWDIVRLSYPSKRITRPVAPLGDGRELVRYSQTPTSTGAYLISRSGAEKFLAPQPRRLPIDHDLRRVWAWDLETYGVMPAPVRADAFGGSTIDAMGSRQRVRRRAQDEREALARFRRGVRDFGLAGWIAAEAVNTAGMLAPRAARPALFAWARARIARVA
ncbi:MAG: glycosyltransferase family 25 protein [Hyphomonadaceae bacterium]